MPCLSRWSLAGFVGVDKTKFRDRGGGMEQRAMMHSNNPRRSKHPINRPLIARDRAGLQVWMVGIRVHAPSALK